MIARCANRLTSGLGLWLFASIGALAAHGMVAAIAIAIIQVHAERDDLGAPGLEIGLELVSASQISRDLPVGPDSDASVAVSAAVEQRRAEQKHDLPQETPTDTTDAEKQVSPDKNKPAKTEPEKSVQATTASEASVAQDATALPSIQDAPVSTRSQTIDQGTGEAAERARVSWQKEFLAHLNRHKRYPADRNQAAAQIHVALKLDSLGRVTSAKIVKSSGDDSFDAAALAMVHRASPVPVPPPAMATQDLSFVLPVVFRANMSR